MRLAIILGGGDGTRAGGPLPKQFQELAGTPILMRTLKRFRGVADRIYLVLHPAFLRDWEELTAGMDDVRIVCGGRTRFDSVRNALLMVADDGYSPTDLVAVHDGARPLVTHGMIADGYNVAAVTAATIPVVPVSDSLRRVEAEGNTRAVNRAEYVRVQTPQVFAADVLMSAYEQPFREVFTDDASVVEADGTPVSTYRGSERNIKITHPMDFRIAELLLAEEGDCA